MIFNGIMWSKQPRSSARKSRFVDIIMGGFWLRSMQLNYSTASPAEEIAFWILPKRILLKTEKCLNFITHQSIAMISIFVVFTWNPSDSIYVFASFESSTYFWAQDMCEINAMLVRNVWFLSNSFRFLIYLFQKFILDNKLNPSIFLFSILW